MRGSAPSVAAVVGAVVCGFWLGACGGAAPTSTPAPTGAAVLAIDGPPDEAVLFVDERPAGSWARTGGVFRLDPGERQLRVEADGFLTYRFSASVVAGETYDVSVELWPCFEGVDAGCVVSTP